MRGRHAYGVIAAALAVTSGLCSLPPAHAAGNLGKINHFIVIYQENWSFDSLYGNFPGADGLAAAANAPKQVDKKGTPYATLPQPILNASAPTGQKAPPAQPDARFPADLPNQPFDVGKYVQPGDRTGDLVHRFYQEQYQIDGGKMDKFVAWSDAAGLALSHYDATSMPEGRLAQQYTMADHFFHAAFGGSFINAFWLICACTPTFPNAPQSMVAQLDGQGVLAKDGAVTPDGFAVNTTYSVNQPHPSSTSADQLLPNQTMPTIGDRLSEKNITWGWFAGGWNNALAGHPDTWYQFHHQPFIYFANYADGTPARSAHLKDEQDFMGALRNNALPAVSFVKFLGDDNEHPGYATLQRGQQHVADVVDAVRNSPSWADSAIIITYDEHGGRWDHVAPPSGDRWGPGSRVPAIIISPFARKGYVDHTTYDTTSILATIEHRWGLAPLGSRDAAAADLANAFDSSADPTGLAETGAGGLAAWRDVALLSLALLTGMFLVSARRATAR